MIPLLVLATHNPGKARELRELCAPIARAFRTAAELGLPEPEETEDSVLGNASLKALAAARASGHPALADDSGLCVAALGGAPGVRSARYAATFAEAMERVHHELRDRDRSAELVTALALAWPPTPTRSERVVAREGRVPGRLAWPPRGTLGFGYEPMFVPHGSLQTYGEMARADKQRDDPRTRAFASLLAALT